MSLAAVRRGFVFIAIAWAAALPLATVAASGAAGTSFLSALTLGVYAVGAVICHQRPERSFFIAAHQMPVCARCTGIYIGAAVAVILVARRGADGARRLRAEGASASLAEARQNRERAEAGGVSRARTVLTMAALPTVATLGYEWTTGVMPANWIRAAAGVCLGAAVAALIQREVN